MEGKELLFSPCQTIKREIIEKAIGVKFGTDGIKESQIDDVFDSQVNNKNLYKKIIIDKKFAKQKESLCTKSDTLFLQKVNNYIKKNYNTKEISEHFFSDYVKATQKEFYPLISTLFKIIGFNCDYSRAGDNGSRWDAIIIDEKKSIPIEIKSPTEEKNISIKAVRQALENKIVLLSR